MNLDRVTITGADDSIDPRELALLSRRFPFVEWGILVSPTRQGGARFPSGAWIHELQIVNKYDGPLKLSLHVCGRWVRRLLTGYDEIPVWLFTGVQRVQLNFHAEHTPCIADQFVAALRDKPYQFIFQIDGSGGNEHMQLAVAAGLKDAVPLFDISGGAGILPSEWPRAASFPGIGYFGYAGGLGPDNLAGQIPKIAEAAGNARVWIDMESRVRSGGGVGPDVFDLDKVERCLQIAEPFVRT